MTPTDELLKLQQLRDAGTLSDAEFAKAKVKLLADTTDAEMAEAAMIAALRAGAAVTHATHVLPG